MKKTFVKSSLQMLATALLIVCGVLLTAQRANAQALTLQSSTASQSINWYDPGQALDIVKNKVVSLNAQLATLAVGSADYIKTYREVVFYKTIMAALESGASTGAAVNQGMKRISGGGDSTQEVGFNYAPTKTELQQLFNQAKGLLS